MATGRSAELHLIDQAGWRAFPPRLPEQPIFYPVLNFEYAEQIARDWNSKDARHDLIGFVTEFDVQMRLSPATSPTKLAVVNTGSSGFPPKT